MNKILIIISLISVILISCEDSAPGDYVENYIIEALLIVDEPIQGISVIKTQPIKIHTRFCLCKECNCRNKL